MDEMSASASIPATRDPAHRGMLGADGYSFDSAVVVDELDGCGLVVSASGWSGETTSTSPGLLSFGVESVEKEGADVTFCDGCDADDCNWGWGADLAVPIDR